MKVEELTVAVSARWWLETGTFGQGFINTIPNMDMWVLNSNLFESNQIDRVLI